MSNTVYGLSVDATQGSARWTTFADPEGNECDLTAG